MEPLDNWEPKHLTIFNSGMSLKLSLLFIFSPFIAYHWFDCVWLEEYQGWPLALWVFTGIFWMVGSLQGDLDRLHGYDKKEGE